MIGKLIQDHLKKMDWTAAHFAAALYDNGYTTSVQAVQSWVNETRTPRNETIPYIAKVLGCDANALFPSIDSK